MIVVDGSALVIAVADTTERGTMVRGRLDDGAMAPHLVDAEVGQALRGLVARNVLGDEAAERSLAAALDLVTERFAHGPLRRRAWELRHRVSFYDGLYVALAESVGLRLITADRRLTRAAGTHCRFLLV